MKKSSNFALVLRKPSDVRRLSLFQRRLRLLAWLMLGALLIEFGVLLYIAGPGREKYRALGRRIALHEGVIYPPRGRILSADGVCLAWSERFFDLYWNAACEPDDRTLALLERVTGGLTPEIGRDERYGRVLKRGLPAAALAEIGRIKLRCPALLIRQRRERRYADIGPAAATLGEVLDHHGISGVEKRFDAVLCGRPGRYQVMLDRNRCWIDRTFVLLEPVQPGRDVRLPLQWEEIVLSGAEEVEVYEEP